MSHVSGPVLSRFTLTRDGQLSDAYIHSHSQTCVRIALPLDISAHGSRCCPPRPRLGRIWTGSGPVWASRSHPTGRSRRRWSRVLTLEASKPTVKAWDDAFPFRLKKKKSCRCGSMSPVTSCCGMFCALSFSSLHFVLTHPPITNSTEAVYDRPTWQSLSSNGLPPCPGQPTRSVIATLTNDKFRETRRPPQNPLPRSLPNLPCCWTRHASNISIASHCFDASFRRPKRCCCPVLFPPPFCFTCHLSRTGGDYPIAKSNRLGKNKGKPRIGSPLH